MQGVGMENCVCLIPESLPSQTAWLEANERMGKGQHVLALTVNAVLLLGGVSPEALIYSILPS